MIRRVIQLDENQNHICFVRSMYLFYALRLRYKPGSFSTGGNGEPHGGKDRGHVR